MTPLRSLRLATKVSQSVFAGRLGVSLDAYRPWDSGRREPPAEILVKAQALANVGAYDLPLALPILAKLLGVSVLRLREAARDGRLEITYETRTAFGRPIPRATRLAGEAYKRCYYGKRSRWVPRPAPPAPFPPVPPDFDRRLRDVRRCLSLSQAQLAERIGAVGKAVVYQWESRKRIPSPLFWSRILAAVSVSPELPRRGPTMRAGVSRSRPNVG
jgi:DNA-binding transcriptional regulator YiaG